MKLNEIKGRIKKLDNYFKDNVSVSSAINDILVKDKTSSEILDHLKALEKSNDSSFVKSYIEGIKKDLYEFLKVEKEIINEENKLNSLIDEIKDELIKRNINIEGIKLRLLTYDRDDLDKQKEYLKELRLRYSYLDETRKSIKKEKEVGSSFSEGFKEGEKSATNIEKVDEEAQNNIKVIINPDIATVLNYLNFYYSNRKSDSNVSLKVEKEAGGSNRTLSVTYFGTEVSEKEPRVNFHFNNSEYFDNEILPVVINTYANENVSLASVNENNTYQNVAESGDTLEMTNMDSEKVLETDDYLEKEKKCKKGHALVRRDNNSYGISNTFFIVLVVLIILIGVLTFILLRR